MKRVIALGIILLCLGIYITGAGAASKGKTNKASAKAVQEEKNIPLITEVMTKEELQAYLKEKNIPIITKENFKEPELVWERTFDEPIREISDITEKSNSIIIWGRGDIFEAERKLIFLDGKGNTRKELTLGKIGSNAFAVATGGSAAVVGKWNEKENILALSYYDEKGSKVWDKDVSVNVLGKIIISDNGQTIAVEEGNSNWSIEEWGGELNISRIIFFDSKGKQLFEYKGYRNIGRGEFSGDGNYYAGLFWWQNDSKTWGKLIYVNVKEGKIQWARPFGGNYWKHGDLFEEDGYLAISESGLYVAAVNVETAEKTPKDKDIFDYLKIVVFKKEGAAILKVPGSYIHAIRDDALIRVGSVRGTASETTKGWIDVEKSRGTGLVGDPPYFIHITGETVWERKEGYADKVGRIIFKKIVGLNGDVLWAIPEEELNYTYLQTKDGQYFKVIKSRKKGEVKILKLKIVK